MAKKSKKDNNSIIIYIVGGIIVVIMFSVSFILNKVNVEENNETEKTNNEIVEEEINNKTISILQDMDERDRMEYYFGEFLEYIENGDYDKAYDLLYDEFKQNYFPTLDEFTEYVQNTFSEMSDIEHENIERNGDVYVLWINITDAINGKRSEKKKMNIVIKENDYNDFVMSFSVI